MYAGQYVFTQVMDHLPWHVFRRCVARYGGDHKIKHFSCLDQFRCFAFAQLTWRESLRDIEACLKAHPPNFIIWAFAANESPATRWPTRMLCGTGGFMRTSRST